MPLWNVSKSKLGGVNLPIFPCVKQVAFSGWSNHTLPAAMHHSGDGPWNTMCFSPFRGTMCTDHWYLLTMVSTQVPSWQPTHVVFTFALEKASTKRTQNRKFHEYYDKHATQRNRNNLLKNIPVSTNLSLSINTEATSTRPIIGWDRRAKP